MNHPTSFVVWLITSFFFFTMCIIEPHLQKIPEYYKKKNKAWDHTNRYILDRRCQRVYPNKNENDLNHIKLFRIEPEVFKLKNHHQN